MTAVKKISFVLLALVLGMAMALIRPAQPKQVEQPKASFPMKQVLLDNEDIPLENGIHNSRKCGFCMVSANQRTIVSKLITIKSYSHVADFFYRA